ncbi:hypothetical protein [Streptomyces decoyicus]|uniref:hypothetical protein n=1 Tax=Streptomyces decoyicus TaxID=249567 RepID=UPI0037F46DF0
MNDQERQQFVMPPLPHASGKKSFGGLCAHLALLVIVLLASSLFAMKGLTAAGRTGIHGTFTVTDCFVHHSSSSRHSKSPSNEFDCEGSFRSDDGKARDDKASLDGIDTDYDARARVPTQAQRDNSVIGFLNSDYTIASRGEVTKNFMAAFAFLLLLPVLLFDWLTGFGETGGTFRHMKEKWRATAGTRTRKIVLTAAAVALGGVVVVSPVLGLVLPVSG